MFKKISILAMALTIAILSLVSCGSDGTGNVPHPPVAGNTIYQHGTQLYVVKDDVDVPSEHMVEIMDAATAATGVNAKFRVGSSEKQQNEIVIGETSRDISTYAYESLPDLTYDTTYFLVYSDGSSLALAYNKDADGVALARGVEYLISNCLSSSSYTHKAGLVHYAEIDLNEYYQAEDDKMLAERWAALEAAVGGELGKRIADAFREHYKIYDDDVIEWFANLYSPRICVCEGECLGTADCYGGGYYYSNSARDTAGYLPDSESTSQALNFLISSGMGWKYGSYSKMLPESVKQDISDFIYYLQDPDDGYFYHPQWGKNITTTRKSRDFTWCNGILNNLGRKPRYSSIVSTASPLTGRLSHSSVSAVSLVIAADGELNIPSHLVDEASFRAYLDNYSPKMATSSYSIGSELTSQSNQIIARDKTLAAAGADYSLMAILIEWLNSHQNPDTGTWDADRDYHSVNGLLKISGIYNAAKVPMPYAEEAAQSAVDAIVSEQPVGAVVDIYNTWFAFGNITKNLRNYGGEDGDARADAIINSLREQAPEAIAASSNKIRLFKKDSGSFSYNLKYSSATSCGAPAAVPESVEGDVNATVISITGLTMNIYEALELTPVRVPIYTYSDWRVYESILKELTPVEKDSSFTIGEPINFDGDTVGEEPIDVTYKGGEGSKGGLTVIADPRPGSKGNVVRLTSEPGAGDTVTVQNVVSALNARVFIFESDFCFESAEGGYVAQITVGNSAYMYIFKVNGDNIELWDSSSANGSVAIDNKFPVSAKLGEWFNVKVEYYYGDHDSVRIKVYWNGKLVGITDNYYDHSGKKLTEKGTPSNSYASTRVYMMSSSKVSLLMDNMHAYKNTGFYTPEEIDIPGAPNVDAQGSTGGGETDEGEKIGGDFEGADNDKMPAFITKSLASSGASVSIADMLRNGESTKTLAFTTTKGANDSLYILTTKTVSRYKSVVFEADIMIESELTTTLYQVMFETMKSEKAYMLNITNTSSGIRITDSSSTSGTSADRHENTVTTLPKVGEWFNLRVEYYVGDRSTLRAHVYIDGKLVYVSDNFYGYYKDSDPEPVNKIERVRFYTMNASEGTLYLDNVSLEQTANENPSPELTVGAQ